MPPDPGEGGSPERDYARVRSAGGEWIAHPACAGDLRAGAADALLRRSVPRPDVPGRGRGGLVVMRLGGETVVAKPALHGGLLAPLLDGLYLGARRARVQIGLAEALRRRGVETPAVLAIGWRRAFGPLVRLALVTRAIPGARNLLEAARVLDPRERRPVLAAAADAVRALHDSGFAHPDLNVTNLVLGKTPGGDRVHVVDLDRGRFAGRSDAGFRQGSLARLLRSHDKWVEPARRLSPREEIRFLRRYCGPDRALMRRLLRGLRRARRRQGALRALRGLLRGGR